MTNSKTDTTAGVGAVWPSSPRPLEVTKNDVVVLLDDAGSAHLGCYGSDVSTPNDVMDVELDLTLCQDTGCAASSLGPGQAGHA